MGRSETSPRKKAEKRGISRQKWNKGYRKKKFHTQTFAGSARVNVANRCMCKNNNSMLKEFFGDHLSPFCTTFGAPINSSASLFSMPFSQSAEIFLSFILSLPFFPLNFLVIAKFSVMFSVL